MVSKIEIDSETRCHDCDTNYLDNSALKVHLELEHGQSLNVHEEEKPFRCEKCKTSYKLKGSFTRHNNLVHEGKDTKEKAIKQKKDMKEEQKKIVHEGKDTKEKALKQKLKKDMKEEQKKIIKEAKEPIVKLEHGQSLKEENTKEKAIKQEQKNDMIEEKKEIVKQKKKKVLKLEQKKKNYRQNNGKPHKCSKCNFRSAYEKDLQRHIDAVHEGKRPYKCDICQADYKRKDELEKHKTIVHEGKKPFQCDICSAEFSGRHSLKNHVRKSHEDSIKPKQINDTDKVEKKKTKTKIIDKEKIKLACEDCGETLNIGESRECETKWKLFLSQCLP